MLFLHLYTQLSQQMQDNTTEGLVKLEIVCAYSLAFNLPDHHLKVNILPKCYLFHTSPTVVVEIDMLSDEDPASIKAAIQEAMSEAVSDGTVGNLNVDPDSVSVEEPQTHEAEKGNDFPV